MGKPDSQVENLSGEMKWKKKEKERNGDNEEGELRQGTEIHQLCLFTYFIQGYFNFPILDNRIKPL